MQNIYQSPHFKKFIFQHIIDAMLNQATDQHSKCLGDMSTVTYSDRQVEFSFHWRIVIISTDCKF